ncbi:MAG: hypothetical protein IID46_15295 [Planctomycetes bacterium]|nr:hypothetical protein [Planctomycetota bacterium]
MTAHELHRATDPDTSRLAAETIEPRLNEVQTDVLDSFEMFGPMTDEELQALPWFEHRGDSTARGRRSELTRKPLELIEDSGERLKNSGGNSVIVWRLKKPKGTLF